VGDDRLSGGAGADHLYGGMGHDRLDGGPGDDVLAAGGEGSVVRGGSGDDRIFTRDGARDDVDCGRGHDTVSADRFDLARRCEGQRMDALRRGTRSH
jgi:Ca2+-binding RTX toxin-like protein